MIRLRWLALGLTLVVVGSCVVRALTKARPAPLVLGIPGAPSSIWVRIDGPERFQVDSRAFANPGGACVSSEWVTFACDRSPDTEFILFLIRDPDPERNQTIFDQILGIQPPNLLDGSETGYLRTSVSRVVDGATWVEFEMTSHEEAERRELAWASRRAAVR